jgi:3-phenylpropionate/trans-cinnamate dioxygenase ferredoxin reductase subunit
MTVPTFVILGAGQAGGRAAETLRREGFDGRIVVVGAEPERPYERPPLSKGILLGETTPEQAYLRPSDYYIEQNIELRLGVQAIQVEAAERTVRLSDGGGLPYDKLLIAGGVTARMLHIPGADLAGVVTLRTMADAGELAAALSGSPRVLIVGAGFIGAEVAAACRKRGLDVTMIEPLTVPMERALGLEIGTLYADIHRDEGVDLRLQTGVTAFLGTDRVEGAVLTTGEHIACDLVLVGVGTILDTGYLDGSEIAIENGVLVDQYCRTNVPDIFAAGDIANWYHPGLDSRLRVEHWDNAEQQGKAAARAMLGRLEPFAPVPYFWSDQYIYALQCFGRRLGGEQEVRRGTVEARNFTTFYLREGVPVAAMCLNNPRAGMAARRLIAAGAVVDQAKLGDESVDLRSLLPPK